MLVIDRFEGEYVLLEDEENHYEIKKSELPNNCTEGDVIVTKFGKYVIDVAQTDLRRKAILNLQRNLWES